MAARRARRRSVLGVIGFAALSYGAAAIGTLAMRGRGRPKGLWYRLLRKPSYQPPAAVFGPVWTILYGTIAYSGWKIWKAERSTARTAALGMWGVQLVLNGAWTPLFFGARRPRLALLDIIALDLAAAGYTAVARRVDVPAARAVVPYLGWLGFATVLNSRIVAETPSALLR
ncbi:MAG: TspO/MBR family protein [Myxococcales bacterium]|nr:TspO/MBR family protein [Myxococcales bacterium]